MATNRVFPPTPPNVPETAAITRDGLRKILKAFKDRTDDEPAVAVLSFDKDSTFATMAWVLAEGEPATADNCIHL